MARAMDCRPEHGLRCLATNGLILLRESTGWWRPALWFPETGEVVDYQIEVPGDVVDAQWYPDAQALLLTHEWHGRGTLYRLDLHSHQLTSIQTEPGTIW